MCAFDHMQATSAYQRHDADCWKLRKAGQFPEARQKLDNMIEIINENPTAFDEPNDHIGILKASKAFLSSQQERLSGTKRQPVFLREAAGFSTPSGCHDQPCAPADHGGRCLTQESLSSDLQSRMCVHRLTYLTNALKLEAAFAAHTFDFDEALAKRRLASEIHHSVLNLDSSPKRMRHQAYLDYWWHVTDGYVSMLRGAFEASQTAFARSLEAARQMNEKRCFPNYFRSRAEITIHLYYIDAVKLVAAGDFSGAKSKFLAWLDANTDHRPTLRSANIEIFAVICDILDRLPANNLEILDWQKLEQLLDRQYTAKTTWALWQRLQWLRELSFKARTTQGDFTRETLEEEVRSLAKEWKLFIPDMALLGEDRAAGLARRIHYCSLIDIFKAIDPSKHDWRGLLVENLRHMLLLMADYEHLRYLDPPVEEAAHPTTKPPRFQEGMSCQKLAAVVQSALRVRSEDHARVFAGALEHFHRFFVAIDSDEPRDAIDAQRSFFDAVRFWPHVIEVTGQSNESESVFLDEDAPVFSAYQTCARRLWDGTPEEIVFEGPQRLDRGSYYYLRPRWNVRQGEHYRVRHERFYGSMLPRWLSVFVDGLREGGKVLAERFHDWILQFPESKRLLACRLLAGLEVYDEEAVRTLWASVFKRLPPEVKRDAVFVGLGHGAKSGRHSVYSFHQAIGRLPEYEALFGGREKKVFRDMAEFEKEKMELEKPKAIVFLDDFIGVGGQVCEFVPWYFKKYKWMEDVQVYLGILVGFRTAIEQRVAKVLEEQLEGVVVGRLIEESERAFSPENSIWSSKEEAKAAEEWAQHIGRQVLPDKEPYAPARDALGWHGCQALVAFHYNVPSDTLPLFWAHGKVNGNAWKPLLDRFE